MIRFPVKKDSTTKREAGAEAGGQVKGLLQNGDREFNRGLKKAEGEEGGSIYYLSEEVGLAGG